MKKIRNTILNLSFMIAILILPYLVLAQDAITGEGGNNPLSRLKRIGANYGPYSTATDENTVFTGIGLIINIVAGFLSVVFLFLIIYAGMKWMTAGGKEEEVSTAKHFLKRAVIGLLIVIGSWGIWELIARLWLSNLA